MNDYTLSHFQELSADWQKKAWHHRYHYQFSWGGRKIIQLPADIIRLQEWLFTFQPDVIIETGVAEGGSQLFYASMCHLNGKGRVIGIEHKLRADTKQAIDASRLAPYITLIEGCSTDITVINTVQQMLHGAEKVAIVLDSGHNADHVLAELQAYSALLPLRSYILVADTCLSVMADTPNGKARWRDSHPLQAIELFLKENCNFVRDCPFHEDVITHFRDGWLRRV